MLPFNLTLKIVAFASCCVWCTHALAQPQHPIDRAFAACTATYREDPNYGGAPAPGRHCEAQAVQAWAAELARLVAKLPGERAAQTTWENQQAQHLAQLRTANTLPGGTLATTGADEIRWYLLDSTRRRVLHLTMLAHEPPFALPAE